MSVLNFINAALSPSSYLSVSVPANYTAKGTSQAQAPAMCPSIYFRCE